MNPLNFVLDLKTVYACISDVMLLTCDSSETLFVSDAFYGVNAGSCPDDTCCAPDDVNDCRVEVSEANADEWLNIREFCNYESECAYQYQNERLIACEGVVADYLELTYVCVSGDLVIIP